VLGRIGIVLGVLAAIGWIVAIVGFDYGPGDLDDDLRRELQRQSRAALIWASAALLGR
jgi:hypothetical protein